MISRAPQTWPSDVTHKLSAYTDKQIQELMEFVASMQDAANEQEDEIEYERRMR